MYKSCTKKEAGYKSFVLDGWNSWNNKERLKEHIGGISSPHNAAKKKCEDLLQRDSTLTMLLFITPARGLNAYFICLT